MTKNAWHLMDIPQALKELNTDPQNGLPSQEVKNRLEKYGYNELKKEERVSPYALMLPFAFVGIWHLFRVRRDGGIAVPPPALRTDHKRITRGELVRRELLGALIAAAVLLLLAVVRPAALEAPIADMQAVTQDALAPWFFLWVQELLRWGDPFLLGVVVPIALVVLLSVIRTSTGNLIRLSWGNGFRAPVGVSRCWWARWPCPWWCSAYWPC